MEHAPEREPDEDRVDQTAMQREEAQRELELEENPEESKSEEAKESLSQASHREGRADRWDARVRTAGWCGLA
jgi:hypothetical protein